MFDFFRRSRNKHKQTSNKPDLISDGANAESEPIACRQYTLEKHCPKCHKEYPAKVVICDDDSTLLMMTKSDAPQYVQTIVAKRTDGSKWPLLCQNYLGSGSICDVYEVLDTASGEKLAAKALMLKLMCDLKSARKFVEGARKGASLQHENIVRTLAIGVTDAKRDDHRRPFLVCEYLEEGKTLSKLIDKHHLPSVTDTLLMASSVCSALEHSHAQGITHGDLKPSNVFLASVGDRVIVKVSDFAIADRLFQGLEWNQITTMTCSLYGSAVYLAPDYADSRTPTATGDIYSLGCIMYECLTGKPPFLGVNDFVTIMQHIQNPPMPFSADYTPKAVADVVMKALEKNPANRWQSAEQMGVAIKVALSKISV